MLWESIRTLACGMYLAESKDTAVCQPSSRKHYEFNNTARANILLNDLIEIVFRALFSRQSNSASLTPISSNTKQQILTESLTKEQDIQITVVRAFNLLDRSKVMIEDSEHDSDTIAG